MSKIWTLAGLIVSGSMIGNPGFLACAVAVENQTARSGIQCKLTLGARLTVTRIIDGETIGLNDGSQARLIGALSPRARDGRADRGGWTPENRTRQALEVLLLGQRVQLAYGETSKDRYGRHSAHVFLGSHNDRRWVQAELLESGLARAYGLPQSTDCFAELLAYERRARDRNLGLWSEPTYNPIAAEQTGLLMSRRSTLQIVRGRVKALSSSKSATYLNFGDDWHTDFTVRIAKQLSDKNPDWGKTIASIKGRQIEVRGWIVRSNGPMIDLADASELTLTDEVALTSDSSEGVNENSPLDLGLPDLVPAPRPNQNIERPGEERPSALDL